MTQGWASESMNGQLRRRIEGDWPQQEIHLLREEVSAAPVRRFLDDVCQSAGASPAHLITDPGNQRFSRIRLSAPRIRIPGPVKMPGTVSLD